MENQLKPFDKVLVRDYDNDPWRANFYSHFNKKENTHICVGSYYQQCIPYNKNTAHLLGTTEPYEKKIWHVKNMSTNEEFDFTQSQFDAFIRDIKDVITACYYITRNN